MKNNHFFWMLFWITSYCCCLTSNAQTRVYKHYSIEDGLPSSEVYTAFQDSKGYMWFATDAGVSRFNGYEFENFDESDGLTDNTVFLFSEDNKGRIWFGTFNCQLSYYENGKIYPFKYNHRIKQKIQSKSAMTSFFIDSTLTIWIGFINEGIYKIDSKGSIDVVLSEDGGEEDSLRMFLLGCQNIVYSYSTSYKYDLDIVKRYSLVVELDAHRYSDKIVVEVDSEKYPLCNIHMERYGEHAFLYTSVKSYLIKKKNKQGIEPIDVPPLLAFSRVLSVYSDKEFLWFCVQDRGVYKCVIKDSKIQIMDHFMKNESVSRVFKDIENGYWFQTLKNGVYYLSSEYVGFIPSGDNSLLSVEIDSVSKSLYTISGEGVLTEIIKKGGRVYEYKELSKFKYKPLSLEYNYYDSTLLIGGGEKYFTYYKGGKFYSCNGASVISRSFFVDLDSIYRVNSYGLSILDMRSCEEVYNSYLEGEPKIWCSSITKNNNKVWIGTNQGVKVYHNGKIKSPFVGNKYLSTGITSMECLDEKLILIGTKSYGLLVLQNDSVMDIIGKDEGLESNIIRKIHIDNDNEIWIATNEGLSRINYDGVGNFQIENLTAKHGLFSSEITDVCSYRNIIYAATLKGLVKFDKTKISFNKKPPKVYITNFTVNNESRIVHDNQLTYQQNFINIKYEGLNYRSLGEVTYQYRMLGVDTNWVSTTSRFVQYPTLQPNEYVFEVKAKNENGVWSDPISLPFTINPPFWLTWWFISLEIVLGLLIIYLVFRYREKQILQRSNIEKRMIELELKALRSQMNPHFIFNILNSIQHYIVANDFRSTNKYLSKFSRLIRTVLNLSEKNVITIEEEVDMLTLYMDLERMRFEKAFAYEINIDDNLDLDYDEIPSMLIQPYVENAIWHGLMNKKEKGIIKIDIMQEGNYLCCSIADNGIGREKAAAIKAKRNIKRKSVGMTITKERLDIINNNEISVVIEDLKDEKGNALGTKVNIKIPNNI